MAVEHKVPVVPRVFFRDGLRTSGGRRPISFPPHPQRYPNPQTADGDAPSWHSFKDRHMPLVLPVLPKEYKAGQGLGKEQKLEMDNLLQTITKKKNMLLPFKSSRPAKNGTEHGEEPTYADLTCRPASAPGELPSVVRINTDDRALLQGSENVSESTISSLDITISPPSAETHTDSESRVFSTLEKAKKKFSRRHVMSPKPKCSSPEKGSKGKAQASPTKSTRSSHSTDLLVPPPIPSAPNLPNFLYISARPFCKGATTFKSPLEKHWSKDKANRPFARIGEPLPPSPQKRPLPELGALGPQPKRPPRPPAVDLSSHMPQTNPDKTSTVATFAVDHVTPQEPDLEHTPSVAVIDAPKFSDFETSEIETVESEAADIVALDLEALDLSCPLDFGEPLPDCFQEPINLSEFPGPLEQWSQSEEPTADPSSCTEEPADCHTIAEDTGQGDHAINFEIGIYQREMLTSEKYPTPCDNVYEDVENISKITLNQNSWKWKGLKNPYADHNLVKEESAHNVWHTSSRSAGDPGYLSRSQINCKECQSPYAFKDQKKREKQRLEREKKELKEREKKENEMKKKFKASLDVEMWTHPRFKNII
uniref:Uncharacterized protein n=1 Tax=Neogobius melanostomus TaxID=47308 RepID=A0A8C6TQ32_9GOBI